MVDTYILQYGGMVEVMEAWDACFDCEAMEGTKFTTNASKKMLSNLNKELASHNTKYTKLMRAKKYDDAIVELDASIKLVEQVIVEAKMMDPDDKRILRDVGKVLIVIAAIILLTQTGKISGVIISKLSKAIPFIASHPKGIKFAVSQLLKTGVSTVFIQPLISLMTSRMTAMKEDEFVKLYGKNPKSGNADYRVLITTLESMKQDLIATKGTVMLIKKGQLENPFIRKK